MKYPLILILVGTLVLGAGFFFTVKTHGNGWAFLLLLLGAIVFFIGAKKLEK